ncbi:ribonuclease H family protein [Pararhizobium sp. O133]|uniref:ribonuclease H family protein n=1 Tax=Pararhizobium sp. O133 TaxID=3449278 RepID=UPI003F684A31
MTETGSPAREAEVVLNIFADGCYEPRSRQGGWAFVVYRDAEEIASGFGGVQDTANNTMELIAVLNAAEWIEANAGGESVTLWTDSVYALNGCNRWRHIWKNNGWKKISPNAKARNRAIPDVDIWKAVDALLRRLPLVIVSWCKGHSGLPGNERADELAEKGRQRRT